MERPLISLRFLIDEHPCMNYYIFPKHSQIVCLINVPILGYKNAKCDCSLWNFL